MVTINLSATGAKEAVARLRAFLTANGISLKQTHGYEALAQTLGYASWNTLQALLNAPTETAASPAETAATDKQTVPANESPIAEQRAGETRRKLGLSPSLEQSLYRAIKLASERHHEHATPEHLLLALMDDTDASRVMKGCNLDMDALRKTVQKHIDEDLATLGMDEAQEAKPTPGFQRPVQRAILHVQNSGRDEVTGANVLVALFAERDSQAVNILQQQGMTRTDAVNYISHGIAKPPEGGQSE